MSQAERTTFVFDEKGGYLEYVLLGVHEKSRLKRGYSSPPQCYSNTYSVRSPTDSRDSSVVLWSTIHNRRNNLQVGCSLHGCTVTLLKVQTIWSARQKQARQRGTWGNTAQPPETEATAFSGSAETELLPQPYKGSPVGRHPNLCHSSPLDVGYPDPER